MREEIKKKQILFINLSDSSFIRQDEDFFKEMYLVYSFKFKYLKGIRVLISLFNELLFTFKYIAKVDIIYIWFSDFHAVIPSFFGRLYRKKVIIVVGGFDAAYEKELNYGVKTRFIGKISAGISYRLATHLLPVTKFTKQDLLRNFGSTLEKKCTLIYNCYRNIFDCEKGLDKKDEITTICLAYSKVTIFRKGVDFYIELAKEFPDVKFNIIGLTGEAYEYLRSISPNNINLIKKIPHIEVRDILCRSKVICQFSRYEAFGIALLEGISAGCYPVGYNYGGTEEILIDDLGILINQLDINEGRDAIERALNMSKINISPIKQSIDQRFKISVRKEKLVDFINSIID